MLDVDGPGLISHLWFTPDDGEPYALKRIVLRIYWDGEANPSVETPSATSSGSATASTTSGSRSCSRPARTRRSTAGSPCPTPATPRITVTDEGKLALNHLYWNIDYRANLAPLPPDTLYFHAQYRQAQPNHGWTGNWYENGDPIVNYRRNLDGKDNDEWLSAKGHGQFLGVTFSVLQNQDGWWGEGNDMFQIDGDAPSITGTGSEDYFLGAWDFGGSQDYLFHGAPVVGKELAGERSSMYRFHFDSPIPFTQSIRASIEHGHRWESPQ